MAASPPFVIEYWPGWPPLITRPLSFWLAGRPTVVPANQSYLLTRGILYQGIMFRQLLHGLWSRTKPLSGG